MWRRCILFACLLSAVPFFSENVNSASRVVVFLYRTEQRPATKEGKPVIKDGKPIIEAEVKYGTGFFVTPDGLVLFLVTANHIASIVKSDFRAIIVGDNDTPLDVSSEELTGTKNVTWVAHDKEDVAVTLMHPSKDVMAKLMGKFMLEKIVSSDIKPPGRERTLTTIGFPLMLGATEHFSPISRESKPVSGLITLPRFDTRTPAAFFLLDNPSIAGFSGAPVLLFPMPYTVPGGMMGPEVGGPTGATVQCVGIVHGTINDDTGGKMAAVTPFVYILETIDKAMKQQAK